MNRQKELRGVATVIVLMVLTVLLALAVVLLSRMANKDKVNNGNAVPESVSPASAPDDALSTAPEVTLPEAVPLTPTPAPEEAAAPPPPLPPPPPPPVPSATVDPKSLPPEG